MRMFLPRAAEPSKRINKNEKILRTIMRSNNEDGEVFVLPLFLNGILEDIRVYNSFDDASADAAAWAGSTECFRDIGEDSPFRGSGVWCMSIEHEPVWAAIADRASVDVVVQWLVRNGGNVWSNVVAHLANRSLEEVNIILRAAADSGRIVIIDSVDTTKGTLMLVRPPEDIARG